MGARLRILDLAAANGGLVDRRSALDRGIAASAIDQGVRSGELIPVHRGVYRVIAVPDCLALRQHAAVIAAGPGAALSHRSAAALHGLVRNQAQHIEVSVLTNRAPALSGVVVHRVRRLPLDHVMSVGALAVTTVERTLADLGAVVAPYVVARAVQSAVVRKLTTAEQLYQLVEDHGRQGRSGIGALRAALDDWVLSDSPPESVLELMFARLVERGGLPHPVLQYEVFDGADYLIARVDAAWPELLVAAEVDGLAHHGTAEALERDLARQNRLILAGWRVLRFTWNDVVRRPTRVMRELAVALDPPKSENH